MKRAPGLDMLWIPRTAFVALKRSIDPHSHDKRRFEILREDFDRFWEEVTAADEERMRHLSGDPR